MAESVVYFLLGEINLFLNEEFKLLSGVRKEVENIRRELEHITVFLRAAEAIEEPGSQLSLLVKEVREIAFDMEDALDEFRLRFAHNGRRDGVNKCKITRFFKNLKYCHQIASQVKGFKPKITEAFERSQRYKLDVPEHVARYATANNVWQERRGDALLLEEVDLVGISQPKEQLIQWLMEHNRACKVISVVGMGGIGKTTLIKKIYDDVVVQKHFKSHVWITVSQTFEITDLLKDIICQLFSESKQPTPQGLETMGSRELKDVIKKFLQESRYLLILDDVWQVEAWDAIKYALPRSKHGNRVMLTTRNQSVADASSVDFKGEVYSLQPLSFEMSWELFCKKTFKEQECPQHLKATAQSIVKRCEGLPLAVVSISGVLTTKKNSTIDEWEMVKRNLGGELESNKLGSLKKILSLSYYDLPFHLKSCLLYISIFPEDYKILRPRLMRLWIAEGFVEEREGKTLEDVANNYLKELIDRSLIQVTSTFEDGQVEFCRVHDLLREVIVSKSKDQNFVMVVDDKNTSWSEEPRRLSFHNSLGIVSDKKPPKGLRSLLVFGIDDFQFSSFGSEHLRLVKVLELRGAKLDVFPNEITKLYHLRYLGLANTNVRDIPPSIGKLQDLETLDLKDTLVTKLPATIVNLVHLRHLLVRGRHQIVPGSLTPPKSSGFEAISEIRWLQSLQVLALIEVNQGNGVIEELGTLKQLRSLDIAKLKREDGVVLCSSIEKLSNLRELCLESTNDGEEVIDLQHISSPPQFLRRLELDGPLEKVPTWITSLCNLVVLKLFGSRLRENVLEAVEALPNLWHLELDGAFDGDELHFKVAGFPKLKELWLANLPALKRMEVDMGAMPCLKFLAIGGVANLENVPFGIENLSKLQELQLTSVSDSLINRIAKRGEDYRRLKHIPHVDVFYYGEGDWIRYPL